MEGGRGGLRKSINHQILIIFDGWLRGGRGEVQGINNFLEIINKNISNLRELLATAVILGMRAWMLGLAGIGEQRQIPQKETKSAHPKIHCFK